MVVIIFADREPTKLSFAANDLFFVALTITGQVGDISARISTCLSERLYIAYSISLSFNALIAFISTLYHTSSLALRSS